MCRTLRLLPLLVLLAVWSVEAAAQAVEVIVLDVGQGDAAVIRSPEGRVALVDAGPEEAGVVGRLRALGVDTIDIAIASHPHADHIGGMDAVLLQMPVRWYMDNGAVRNTDEYRELVRAVGRSGASYVRAADRTIELGSVALKIMRPPIRADAVNNQSVGVVVEYGAFTALFTGDSEIEELNYFLTLGVPDVTLLKAAHHGSRDAVSPLWVDRTRPEVVVISCGRDNPYGHPHPWALRYYRAVAQEIYRTDLHGTVTVLGSADGSYEVVTEAPAPLGERR